jgi:hypothetical protein
MWLLNVALNKAGCWIHSKRSLYYAAVERPYQGDTELWKLCNANPKRLPEPGAGA